METAANLAEIVHDCPVAKVVPQVVDTKLNPTPETLDEVGTVILSGPTPVFVSVDVKVVELPAATFPKLTFVSVALCATPVPVPA